MGKVAMLRRRVIPKPRRKIPHGRRRIKAKSYYPKRTIILHKRRLFLYKWRTAPPHIFKRIWDPTQIFKPSNDFWRKMRRIWGVRTSKQWEKKISDTWKPLKPRKPISRKPTIIKKTFPTTFKKQFRQTISRPRPEIKKKVGKPKLGGAGNWGPMGEFPEQLIFQIQPTSKFYKWMRWQKMSSYGAAWIVEFEAKIKYLLQEIQNRLYNYADDIIYRYVPRETGDLQKAMLKSLARHKPTKWGLKITMSTKGIDYAMPVNQMPEKMIQHPHAIKKDGISSYIWQRGRRSGKILFDPHAKKNFFNVILLMLKTKAIQLLNIFARELMLYLTSKAPAGGYRRESIRTLKLYDKTTVGWKAINKQTGAVKILRGDYGAALIKKIREGTFKSKYSQGILGTGTDLFDKYEIEPYERVNVSKTRFSMSVRDKNQPSASHGKDFIKGWFKVKGLKGYKGMK